MSSRRQQAEAVTAHPGEHHAGVDQSEGGPGAQAGLETEADDRRHSSVSPQAERARRVAAAARARTARIRSEDFGVDTRAAPRGGPDRGRPGSHDDGAEPVGPPEAESRTRVDRPEAFEPRSAPGRDRHPAPVAADPLSAPGLNDAPSPAPFDIERAGPPFETETQRTTVREASAGPATLEVEVPAMPVETRQEARVPGGKPSGDASAKSPRDPAPRAGNGVAGGRFARTKQAVAAERFDAGEGRAWSHVLRTPEEIGATQDSLFGRLLRRLWPFGRPARPSAGAPPAERAIGDDAARAAGFRRRPSRTATGGRRGATTFVFALGTGALVTSLLFGGLLGLPEDAPLPKWVSWPFDQEDRPATRGAKGEVVIAGLPEAAGQGGPEIALGAGADGSLAMDDGVDVAARGAGSKPAVTVAGSAQDIWRQYYRLGHRLHAEGDLRGAVEMYQQAATLEPRAADTFYDWARALQMLGDRTAAIEKYRAALELAPDGPTGADARARLSELRAH